MREFCRPSVPIYMYDKDNNYRMQTIGEVGDPFLQSIPIPQLGGERGLTISHKTTSLSLLRLALMIWLLKEKSNRFVEGC